ncbi:hypothetical protein Anas_10528, partial [Armadillidium nasatum]
MVPFGWQGQISGEPKKKRSFKTKIVGGDSFTDGEKYLYKNFVGCVYSLMLLLLYIKLLIPVIMHRNFRQYLLPTIPALFLAWNTSLELKKFSFLYGYNRILYVNDIPAITAILESFPVHDCTLSF